MVDEIHYVQSNAEKTAIGKCPQIPVLCSLSNNKGNLKTIPRWEEVHREYSASNQQTEFVELACGHYVHSEQPEKVAKAIEAFIH